MMPSDLSESALRFEFRSLDTFAQKKCAKVRRETMWIEMLKSDGKNRMMDLN